MNNTQTVLRIFVFTQFCLVVLWLIYVTSRFSANGSENTQPLPSKRLIKYTSTQLMSIDGTTPEEAQKPQSLILAYYRSGSTFLGELLSAVEGSYYSFEPLAIIAWFKIRKAATAKKAVNTLSHILRCNYTGLEHSNKKESFQILIKKNDLLWHGCNQNMSVCSDTNYLNEVCAKSKYHTLKEVRLLAKDTEKLLEDPELNIKILLLIRDPRAIMLSRRQADWCVINKDCMSVSNLCADMEDDFASATNLTRKYPQRFSVVRYENISTAPYDMTAKILKFYGLPFDDKVKEFLDSHTNTTVRNDDHLGTYRDSTKTPFVWIEHMNLSTVQEIQSKCSKAMALWGYKIMDEEMSLIKDAFNPLLDFPFSIDDVL